MVAQNAYTAAELTFMLHDVYTVFLNYEHVRLILSVYDT